MRRLWKALARRGTDLVLVVGAVLVAVGAGLIAGGALAIAGAVLSSLGGDEK